MSPESDRIASPFDAVVVGGGPAGLSAALVLGRMRRRLVLLDTNEPANAVSRAMHGFLSRDGTPPAEVRRAGREQLRPYDTVEVRSVGARAARRRADERFELDLGDGSRLTARRLLLAHGMRYGLPDVDGVAELWGECVFHCPYCHGWEVRDRPIAVYACGAKAAHQALLLSSLSDDVVLVGDENFDLSAEQRRLLEMGGIELSDDHVVRVERADCGLRIVFEGRRPPLPRHALFIQPDLTLPTDLALSLGAQLSEVGRVATDESGQTSVLGLYAAGDAGRPVQSVAVASGSGARAAYAINAELAIEDARDGAAPAASG